MKSFYLNAEIIIDFLQVLVYIIIQLAKKSSFPNLKILIYIVILIILLL